MSKILVIQHARSDALGIIGEALEDAALAWQYIKAFEGGRVPDELGAAGGLIVMGGPQSVYEVEQFGYLREELRLIELALEHDLPILGVGLGSQMLAAVLGGKVSPAQDAEIGWFPVTLTEQARADRLFEGLPRQFTPLHWHSDVFDLPKGAVLLASSNLTPHQAFRWGNKAWGLLFHMELTGAMMRERVDRFAEEVREAQASADELQVQAEGFLAPLQRLGVTLFGRWAAMIHQRS